MVSIQGTKGGVVDEGRLFRAVERAKGGDAPVSANLRPPSSLLSAPDTAIARRVVFTQADIGNVLRPGHKANVAPSVIEFVLVPVVDLLPWERAKDNPVHQDVLASDVAMRVARAVNTPPMRQHKVSIGTVDEREFALGEGNKDTIVRHGDLQSLCHGPGQLTLSPAFLLDEIVPKLAQLSQFQGGS